MPVITDSIVERTAAAGVTIDGLLIKDGSLPDIPGAAIDADQSAALAAYETALAGASAGQVLTASGPGAAAFAAANAPDPSIYPPIPLLAFQSNNTNTIDYDAIYIKYFETTGEVLPLYSNLLHISHFNTGSFAATNWLVLNHGGTVKGVNLTTGAAYTFPP